MNNINSDKAILYNTARYKFNKALDKMRKIGLNVTKYEEADKKIAEDLKASINKSYSFDNVEILMQDVIDQEYQKATIKIEALYQDLNKYEVYLKVASFSGVLREFLLNNPDSPAEILKIGLKLRSLLTDIKNSNTLDYDIEGPLVEDIYHLAYEFIKIELKVIGNSLTLDFVNSDDVHKYNIDREITHELENLNLKEAKYKNVVKRRDELDSKGLNETYVDLQLIEAIINTEKYADYSKLLSELTNKLNEYYQKLKDLTKMIETKETNYNTNKTKKEEYYAIERKKISKNVLNSLASLSAAVVLAISLLKLGEVSATDKKYHTTTANSLEDTISEEYLAVKELIDSENVGRFLYEYSPYQKTGIFSTHNFVRTITTYDLSSLESLSLEEYLELDLKSLGIKGDTEKEFQDNLTLNDLYENTYFILQEVEEENFIKEQHLFLQISLSLLFIIVEFVVLSLLDHSIKGKLLTANLRNILESLRKLKVNNQDLATSKKELRKIHQEFYTLVKENESLLLEATKVMPYIEERESEELEDKLNMIRALIKKNSNN